MNTVEDQQFLERMAQLAQAAERYALSVRQMAEGGLEKGYYNESDVEPTVEPLLDLVAGCYRLMDLNPDLARQARQIATIEEMTEKLSSRQDP